MTGEVEPSIDAMASMEISDFMHVSPEMDRLAFIDASAAHGCAVKAFTKDGQSGWLWVCKTKKIG